MTTLKLNGISLAPGYRDLTLRLIDPVTKEEYELRLPPQDVERLIHGCAEAVKQIGEGRPPIDWEEYPQQIRWPEITPWMAGPRSEQN